MTAPAPPLITINIAFESKRPKVMACWGTDSDEARMMDWLESQPGLLDIVVRAIELGEELRAA